MTPVSGACGFAAEQSLTRLLAKGWHWIGEAPRQSPVRCESLPARLLPQTLCQQVFTEECCGLSLQEDGHWRHFPDAGWHVYRSRRVFFFINAGKNGQNGNGGHAHNDRLSFELCIDGVDIIRDPGTGLYTPAPEVRNRYRASSAHSAPAPQDMEQNRFEENGLFWMYEDARAWTVEVKPHAIVCALHLPSGFCVRTTSILPHAVLVEDAAEWALQPLVPPLLFSPGYGKFLVSNEEATAR